MNVKIQITLASLALALGACSGGIDEPIDTSEGALDTCVFGTPAVTEIREENPGPVAAGISKIYHVTVRNTNSAACEPATLFFVPDSFHLFSVVAQPSSISGVGSNQTASFRVTATSDPSVPEGVTQLGFTVVNDPGGTSVRGSLAYEVDFDFPVGCNRQRPQISVTPASPAPVPTTTPVTYQITVRNVDNRECGPDTFNITPDSFRLFSIQASGPLSIPAGGNAVFTETVASADLIGPSITDLGFTVIGSRHGALTGRGSVRYIVQ